MILLTEYKTDIDYINDRLLNQQQWFSVKSTKCQKSYKWRRRAECALTLSMPILQFIPLPDDIYNKMVVLLCGGIATYIHFTSDLENYFELWKKYRLASEQLKKEYNCYVTNADPYQKSPENNRFALLVNRVEHIISQTNKDWTNIIEDTPNPPAQSSNTGS